MALFEPLGGSGAETQQVCWGAEGEHSPPTPASPPTGNSLTAFERIYAQTEGRRSITLQLVEHGKAAGQGEDQGLDGPGDIKTLAGRPIRVGRDRLECPGTVSGRERSGWSRDPRRRGSFAHWECSGSAQAVGGCPSGG